MAHPDDTASRSSEGMWNRRVRRGGLLCAATAVVVVQPQDQPVRLDGARTNGFDCLPYRGNPLAVAGQGHVCGAVSDDRVDGSVISDVQSCTERAELGERQCPPDWIGWINTNIAHGPPAFHTV